MPYITTNDGIQIHYEVFGEGKPLVMVSGGSTSMDYFTYSAPRLAEHMQVVLMDTRGRGDSDKPMHGNHLARYGTDLKNLIDTLDLHDVTILGWSVGVAVCWNYLELYASDGRVTKFIDVDQIPAQFRQADWPYGHAVSYNYEQYIRMCYEHEDLTYEKQLANFVNNPLLAHLPQEFLAQCAAGRMKCPAEVGIRYMRDHTTQDYRDFIPTIKVETLALLGGIGDLFPLKGVEWVPDHIEGAKKVIFEGCGHSLHMHNPEKFEKEVIAFVCGEEA